MPFSEVCLSVTPQENLRYTDQMESGGYVHLPGSTVQPQSGLLPYVDPSAVTLKSKHRMKSSSLVCQQQAISADRSGWASGWGSGIRSQGG
jgi:hypothetical protein